MILLIDHYDSFTYNIYQSIAELGVEVEVVRYGVLSAEQLMAKKPQAIILSPGPGHPEQLPESLRLIRSAYRTIPILGICLGHQLLGMAFGGEVAEAPEIRHGKVSAMQHNGDRLFADLKQDLPVMRYHSLAVREQSMPDCLEIQARAKDDQSIMAIRHRNYPVYGLQFHPESIGTPDGAEIMAAFVSEVKQPVFAE